MFNMSYNNVSGSNSNAHRESGLHMEIEALDMTQRSLRYDLEKQSGRKQTSSSQGENLAC